MLTGDCGWPLGFTYTARDGLYLDIEGSVRLLKVTHIWAYDPENAERQIYGYFV